MTYNESSHPATGVKAIASTLWYENRELTPQQAATTHRFVLLITDGISTETQAGSDNFTQTARDYNFKLVVLHLRTGGNQWISTSCICPAGYDHEGLLCIPVALCCSVFQGQGGRNRAELEGGHEQLAPCAGPRSG